MTNSEAKEIIIKERDSLQANPIVKVEDCLYEAFEMAIKVLEQQPCEDCVSREAVKKQFEEVVHNNGSATEFLVRLWKLQPVQPTRPTGRWIEKEDYNLDTYYDCSECGESFCLIDGTPTDNLYNYCPNCGAKMTESEDKE